MIEDAIFDEEGYLAANMDVALAVRNGSIRSGREHYHVFGKNEQRPLNLGRRPEPMRLPVVDEAAWTRRDKILASLDLAAMRGLEIGALSSPLVRKDEGKLVIVDHVDTETLKEKYKDDPLVNGKLIYDVDAVWGCQSLKECVGDLEEFDYVVASHVIEHVPDLVTWLDEVRSVLRANGSLRLAVPDKRFTFDLLRHTSALPEVMDAYIRRARSPLPRVLLEYYSRVASVNCTAAWDGSLNIESVVPLYSKQYAIDKARFSMENNYYEDAHCWVFTPSSFADLMIELVDNGMLKFKCDYFFDTKVNTFEFFVAMSPSDSKAEMNESWSKTRASLVKTS